jgi:hypothetical protein
MGKRGGGTSAREHMGSLASRKRLRYAALEQPTHLPCSKVIIKSDNDVADQNKLIFGHISTPKTLKNTVNTLQNIFLALNNPKRCLKTNNQSKIKFICGLRFTI